MLILKEYGYDFIELALTPAELDSIDEEYTNQILAIIKETGLPICSTSIGHFTRFSQQYSSSETRSITLGALRKLVEFSSRIGADVILLATLEEGKFEEYAPIYREGLKDIANYSAEQGVKLALEHVGRYKPSMLEQLIRYISHEAVRVYFDIGNSLAHGEDPVETIERLGDLLAQVHLKGTREVSLERMPLVQIRRALERHGYKGRGCLEIRRGPEGNEHLRDALRVLREAGY